MVLSLKTTNGQVRGFDDNIELKKCSKHLMAEDDEYHQPVRNCCSQM